MIRAEGLEWRSGESVLGLQLGSGTEQAACRAPGLTPKCPAGAAANGGYSLFQCVGFSLPWLL